MVNDSPINDFRMARREATDCFDTESKIWLIYPTYYYLLFPALRNHVIAELFNSLLREAV